MKRSKQNNKSDSSHLDEEKVKETNICRKTREQYKKEIAESKKGKTTGLVNECVIKDESITAKEQNSEKFSELKKYLLADLSGKNTSAKEGKNSGKIETGSKKNKKSPKKKKMIDTREDFNQESVQTAQPQKNSPKTMSPSKKNSIDKSSTNVESENETNVKEKSPKKALKLSPSPDKMLAVTKESPRSGSRQRSPNLRYADDMVIFPLKPMTKRQIFKKDNNTSENMTTENNNPHPKTSQTIECQTSQLYSLLTKNVVSVPTKEQTSPLKSGERITEQKSKDNMSNENTESDAGNGDISGDKASHDTSGDQNKNTSCDMSGDKNKTMKVEPVDPSVSIPVKGELKDVVNGESLDISEEKDEMDKTEEPMDSKISNKVKKEPDLAFLDSLNDVIDQIIVESTQEETPHWAVYKNRPPKIKNRRKRKPLGKMSEFKVETNLHELQTDIDASYSILEKKDSTPWSSGDEDDLKGRRRTTKPISKSSIIRMSPALGLLVGHDEDGFRTLNEKKKRAKSKNKDIDKPADKNKQSETKPENAVESVLDKESTEPKQLHNKKSIPNVVTSGNSGLVVSSNTIVSNTSTQSQIKLLGNAGIIGAKATIVSGSQTLPCVLVSTSSNLKPQSLLNLQRPNMTSQNSLIIPANRISLIGTASTKSTSVAVVSPPTSVLSPMVSVNVPLTTANIRPNTVQMVSQIGQPVSVLRTPLKKGQIPANAYFRLSSDGQLISTQRPFVSVKTPTTGHMGGTVVSSVSGLAVNTNTARMCSPSNSAINLPPKSKVLILKKSDVPMNSQILVGSPSASGIRPGMSLLKRLPVTTNNTQPMPVVTTANPVSGETSKIDDAKKKDHQQQPKLVTMETSEIDDTNKKDEQSQVTSVAMESIKSDDGKHKDEQPQPPMETRKNDDGRKKEEQPQHLLQLNHLIDKIKTNMNSLMELPECLSTGSFMDSVMINEEYESESEEEPSADMKDDVDKIDEQNNKKSTTTEGIVKDQDLPVPSIKNDDLPETTVKDEDLLRSSAKDEDLSVGTVKDKNFSLMTESNGHKEIVKDSSVVKTEAQTPKSGIESEISEESVKNDNQTTEETKVTETKDCQKLTDKATVSQSEISIDCNSEQNSNIQGTRSKSSSEERSEPVKGQSISRLEDKLKKAMESLSNVKSVLAAKNESSKIARTDLSISKEKTPVPAEMSNFDMKEIDSYVEKTENEKLNLTKEASGPCGSCSESEDHESGCRRNIFDVIMKDYQSPNKDGKSSDSDNEKLVIEIKDSPVKKGDRSLFDLGLSKKPTTETDSHVITKQQDEISQDVPHVPSVPEKHDDISETESTVINDEVDQIDKEMLENEEQLPMNDDLKTDTDSKELDTEHKTCTDNKELDTEQHTSLLEDGIDDKKLDLDDGIKTVQLTEDLPNKSEIQEELSDSNDCLIIEQEKTELVTEDISAHKDLTMADKLLAKFKEWEIEESGSNISLVKSTLKVESSETEVDSGCKTPILRSPVKFNRIGYRSPFSKPPIKLKICSSPDKSYIVATSENSNNLAGAGRPVPKTSTQKEIKTPLPMNVLTKPEQEVKDKMSAFSSQILDTFLEKQATIVIHEDDDEDDDDDENENDSDDDSDVSLNEHEPDFDEIDGILFMSFPSKNALTAHVQVERRTKLGTDENLLLGMTRMRNMRRKQGYILSKYNRKIGNKYFKDQDNISQNLRGMHKTLAKYQRLYKQELHWLEHPDDDSKMYKTNDITKIKGWKNKVGNVTDDVEYAKAEIENGGKLHWRTEARLAKNLRPDELKEYGLNIKKKRRKNIIYTQRKGMSKGDRSQRTENGQDEFDDSRSNSNEIEFIHEEVEDKDPLEEEQEHIEGEDVTIIFDPDDDVQDEELVKINEREIMKEDETKKNTERHRMFIKAQMLKKRLGYNLRDVQVIRKLGGHNIRRRKNAEGIYEGDYMVMDSNTSRPSTPEISQTEEADTPHKKNRKPKNDVSATVLSSNMVTAACSALPKEYIRKKPPKPKLKETDVITESPEPGQSSTCDKPGCRYGCICHLCVFTEQSPEAAARVVKCEKEYCRLGCICDSIEARKDKNAHCGKTECMVECICEEDKRNKKEDKDYHYSGQKKNSKFATLPKRESTYRLAKNLDAVSRKAMLYYESSEMFVDQKVRRRRSKESTTDPPPQVYLDVDLDDYDMDQQVTSVATKSRKQEFSGPKTTLHKPVPIKPKPHITKKTEEMTDFSNIKSEISSQGSWNLSDLSDEYEDVDASSDKDLEFTTCARTTVYKAIKRTNHVSGCTCSKKSSTTDGLVCDVDAKFNIPDDILSSGKWHTQWICLRSKGQTLEDKGGLRLLEVISNCNYEEAKGKILSRLTSHISKDSYPKIKSFIVGDFQVTFLPKSDKPAVIPPEVKAKLPDSVYSIRIKIMKSGIPQVINLVNDQDETEQKTMNEKEKLLKKIPAKKIGQSELAKHLTSNVTLTVHNSPSPVPGGISGFSKLQITRPAAPVAMTSVGQVPCTTSNQSQPLLQQADRLSYPNTNVGGVSCAITVSQPINVVTGITSSTSVTSTERLQKFPGYVVNSDQTSQPNSSYSVLGTYSNLQAARDQLSNIVKNQMMRPRVGIVPNSTQLESQNILKRKLPEEPGVLDSKKSKVASDVLLTQAVSNETDDSIGQISVLRCVRCQVILTAEDITSWVLSPHENVQQKICVKCRNIHTIKPVLPAKMMTSMLKSSSPIVIDSEEQMASNNSVLDTINSTDKNNKVEKDPKKTEKNQEVDNSVLQLDCENIDSLDENSSESAKIKQDDSPSKAVIDVSSGDESKEDDSKCSDHKKQNKVIKVQDNNSGTPLEIEDEDELAAAIRDAQDDFDNMARNLSDENESQEDDLQKNQSLTKSNVILIDDEDDDDNFVKPNTDSIPSKSLKRRCSDEEEEVDITSFSENDVMDLSSFSTSDVPHWHSSSCSVHTSLFKKKRKSQLDLIENKQLNEIEIKESSMKMSYEEYRRWKLARERKRRTEMDQLYKDISKLVMTEDELRAITKFPKYSPQTKILDKVLEYIKVEGCKSYKLEGKVKAFRHYQHKLKQRLEELKNFHIERGISKSKLDFQLDKIAVVCDKIYEHLPEIKKHIKNKKDNSDTPSTSTPEASVKSKVKQVKKSKPAACKKRKSAEIYIDNPEEYGEGIGNQSVTPLVSLPGSYGNIVPTVVREAIVGQQPLIRVPVKVQPTSGVSMQGTGIIRLPVAGLQAPNIRLQVTGTPVLSNVGMAGPSHTQADTSIFPSNHQSTITVPSVGTLPQIPYSGGIPVQVSVPLIHSNATLTSQRVPSSSVVTSTNSDISLSVNSHTMPKQTVGMGLSVQTSTMQNVVIGTSIQYSPEISKILNAPSGVQNLGQHPSTSAFSEVIGQIIKKNISEDLCLDDKEPENKTDSQTAEKQTDKSEYVPPIPKYDVNLLKDQILDDATGELISVVINDEDTENQDNEKNIESPSTYESNKNLSENQKSLNQLKTGYDDKEPLDASSEKVESVENDDTNIESLLNDIKSLSGGIEQDESPKQTSNVIKQTEQAALSNSTLNDPVGSLLEDKTDQVDGDIFSFCVNKDGGNLSESDSNNSAQTNPYMEDSDCNNSNAGDISDGESSAPKIISVMSIADVLGDGYKSVEGSPGIGPQGDNDSVIMTSTAENENLSENL